MTSTHWIGLAVIAIVGIVSAWPKIARTTRIMTGSRNRRNNHAPSLSNEALAALSVGAAHANQQDMYINCLEPGIEDVSRLQSQLASAWEVTDSCSAEQAIEHLLREGHRVWFPAIAQFFHIESPAQRAAAVRQHFAGNQSEQALTYLENYLAGEAILRERGDVDGQQDRSIGICGWDASRAVSLARLAYGCRLLSEQTAWHYIRQAHTLARSQLADWNALYKSLLMGRAMWAGTGQHLDGFAYGMRQGLLEDAGSPWRSTPLHPFAHRAA